MRAEKHSLTELFHQYFVFILIGVYAIASLVPEPGIWLRTLDFDSDQTTHSSYSISFLLLAILFFNAGLGVHLDQIQTLLRHAKLITVALGLNLILPIILILLLQTASTSTLIPYENFAEILIGLSMVAAMPVANSSIAWVHNANGNIGMCIVLVSISTLLSPFTVPFVISATSKFIVVADTETFTASLGNINVLQLIVIPFALGIITQFLLNRNRIRKPQETLKTINALTLLLLNYMHASAFLPQMFAQYMPTAILYILFIPLFFCLSVFGIGWWTSGKLEGRIAERKAVMFSVGMNNNGVALVFASLTMEKHPGVTYIIIVYTLIQHIVAAFSMHLLNRKKLNAAKEENNLKSAISCKTE